MHNKMKTNFVSQSGATTWSPRGRRWRLSSLRTSRGLPRCTICVHELLALANTCAPIAQRRRGIHVQGCGSGGGGVTVILGRARTVCPGNALQCRSLASQLLADAKDYTAQQGWLGSIALSAGCR